MSSNPYEPPVTALLKQQPIRSNAFGRYHLVSFGIVWILFGGLYAWIVYVALDPQPGKWFRVIATPFVTLISPMVGAFSRGATQGCCFDTSVLVLTYMFPLPLLALASQHFWRPSHRAPQFLRGFLWLIFWCLWFGSGLLPLGHAVS